MAARCKKCSYVLSSWQEISTLLWILLKTKLGSNIVAGPLNAENVKCPSCGKTGRWVDE